MERAPRSLKVHPGQIAQVKAAYGRSGCFNQKDLAEELGLSLDTLSKFLNGKPVDRMNALQICDRLSLAPDATLMLGTDEVDTLEATPMTPPALPLESLAGGELAPLPPMDVDFEAVEDAPVSTAEPDTKMSIKQTATNNDGFMFGHVNRVKDKSQTKPADDQADAVKPPQDIDIEQSVETNTGFMFGHVDQLDGLGS